MADITITDNLAVSADLEVSDASTLAKAGLKQLISHSASFVSDLDKPIDQTDFKTATFGAKFSVPSELIAKGTKFTVKSGVCGVLSLSGHDQKKLFDDQFSPEIAIAPDERWLSLGVDVSFDANLAATVDGVGVAVEGITTAAFTTYSLVKASGGTFPSLRNAITCALQNYTIDYSADAVRQQPAGTVNVNDVSGTLKFSASYCFPVSVSALASADLPFNYKIDVKPAVTLKVAGEIALTGDFIVRAYRVNAGELHFGVYKKKGSSFKASLTAGAGIQAAAHGTDLVAAFFGAVVPGVDLAKEGITGKDADALKGAIKDCLDHSLLSFHECLLFGKLH